MFQSSNPQKPVASSGATANPSINADGFQPPVISALFHRTICLLA
jgi:hypothetical protein